MDKLKMETHDLTAANVQKIAELFPGVVAEGKVNFDLLRTMLGDDVMGDEAYEFTWVGKREAIREAGRPIRKTLRPCVEESKNWDTTENLYIEGDNLEVLKLLQESYLGKIKMIYIDPPYNTGNDFVYRDNFTVDKDEYDDASGVYDEERGDKLFRNTERNGRFHSYWCSMMYPRLVLARNLLSDDGIIFISIDDKEQSSLKKICDEIFGDKNFICNFIWNINGHTDNQFKVKVNHEFIMAYSKNYNNDSIGYVIDPNTRQESNLWKGFAENSITKNGPKNPVSKICLKKGFPCINKDTIIYKNTPPQNFFDAISKDGYITRQLTEKFNVEYPIRFDDMIIKNGILTNDVEVLSGWGNANKLKKFINNGYKPIHDGDETTSFYLSEKGVIYYKKIREKARNILSVLSNMGTTEQMRSELESNKIYFSYPKPKNLIEYMLKIGLEPKGSLVLDFFSGSSTTAHAVMQLNAKDCGKRRFIMVQLPEVCAPDSEAAKAGYKNICEIGKERIRRAGEKIRADVEAANAAKPDADAKAVPDIGFRVLKLDDSNMKDVYYAAGEYTQGNLQDMVSNIKDGRTDMDLLYGCLLDWGLPLSLPHTQEQIDGVTVHTYNDGDLIACFAPRVSEKVVKEIAGRQPLRVVFRDSSFASSPDKINVEEIFKLFAPHTTVKVL